MLRSSGPKFAVYGQADLPKQRSKTGRIDLLAAGPELGLVVEASTFGAIKMSKLVSDAERLERFAPQHAWRFRDGHRPSDFWDLLAERWAVLAITCFSQPAVPESWDQLLNERALDRSLQPAALAEVRAFGPMQQTSMRKLGKFLRGRQSAVGRLPVVEEGSLWDERQAGGLHLLWAAWKLEATAGRRAPRRGR